ncbi:MAG: amidohydrolase [Gemmatimonadetes bacterium]|nr:amidohydrolase [Gemmatimonadota bacterium]MDA1103275.1 amidohydrolase [Gemmatimonadota bacterium]
MVLRTPVVVAVALVVPGLLSAQNPKEAVTANVVAHAAAYEAMAMHIWDLAEMGYEEHQSSGALQAHLAENGFSVDAGVAGMPTAFVASYGSGDPVIGILAEFDALPGLGQDRFPNRSPIPGKAAGHACGHNLFGVGSMAAALAVKAWLEESGRPGTIRLFGTPAEEGGGGKIYMSRAGLFADVDAMLEWHASDHNDASPSSTLANISVKFRFTGVSAHAARAPERGRSALDGVEAMNFMANLMREHVPQETRIHYVITNGGLAPNVVPDAAEVYYYLRHPDAPVVRTLLDRLIAASEGAAQGTGTEVTHEIVNGVYNILPNTTMARVMHANLVTVGGVEYDASERRFAELMYATLPAGVLPIESAAIVQPFDPSPPTSMASSDVGDVSWVVPTTGLNTATYVPGVVSHTWQAAAVSGTSIGTKGMLVAAKTVARSAVDFFLDPGLVAAARAEFEERRGAGSYVPFVGDRDPPLDYRRTSGN